MFPGNKCVISRDTNVRSMKLLKLAGLLVWLQTSSKVSYSFPFVYTELPVTWLRLYAFLKMLNYSFNIGYQSMNKVVADKIIYHVFLLFNFNCRNFCGLNSPCLVLRRTRSCQKVPLFMHLNFNFLIIFSLHADKFSKLHE